MCESEYVHASIHASIHEYIGTLIEPPPTISDMSHQAYAVKVCDLWTRNYLGHLLKLPFCHFGILLK